MTDDRSMTALEGAARALYDRLRREYAELAGETWDEAPAHLQAWYRDGLRAALLSLRVPDQAMLAPYYLASWLPAGLTADEVRKLWGQMIDTILQPSPSGSGLASAEPPGETR